METRRRKRAEEGSLTDESVRRIEEMGALEVEVSEGLDLPEIRKMEKDFWAKTWEDAEPFSDESFPDGTV